MPPKPKLSAWPNLPLPPLAFVSFHESAIDCRPSIFRTGVDTGVPSTSIVPPSLMSAIVLVPRTPSSLPSR